MPNTNQVEHERHYSEAHPDPAERFADGSAEQNQGNDDAEVVESGGTNPPGLW